MKTEDAVQEEAINIFKESGALLTGHFKLRSGLHSGHFFQCAQVCQYIDKVTRLTELLIEKVGKLDVDVVLAPAMGGLVIGQEVARQLGVRYIFVEKVDDKLELRRNFKIAEGEKVLIVEDVVTRGGRVQEALDIVESQKGDTVGVFVLVDRSEGKNRFGNKLHSLVELSFPTYQPDALPEELASIPVTKPGS